MEPGVRWLEIEGDRRHASHPTAVRGCVGAAQGGGARPCPERDPLARPAIAVGVLSEGRISVGVEKKHSRADMRGPAGSGCKRRGETRGRGRRAADTRGPAAAAVSEGGEHAGVAGLQAGPRARWGWRSRWCWLGWLAWAERLAARPTSSFPFSIFHFSFISLNSNLVLVFEFKNWCTKFIRVLDM